MASRLESTSTGPLIPILTFETLDEFDTVDVDCIETCRRMLGSTPAEFAEQLGWSLRKYQRTLEATREKGMVDRDVALAIRGLVTLLYEQDNVTVESPITNKSFFRGRRFSKILPTILDEYGGWAEEVTPHLLRLLADRAAKKKQITYGEAATMLEEDGLTRHVWPRTAYGRPLGIICEAMIRLGNEADVRVPLLSAIVVRSDGEPGDGLDGMIRRFIRQYEDKECSRDLISRLARDREGMIAELQREVFNFQHWQAVLWTLGLSDK